MKVKILSLALFFAAIDLSAQLQTVIELDLSKVSNVSVDRLGNFYFVLQNGRMLKVDPDGKTLNETTKSILPLTLLEPWNPLKVFTYSNDTKKYQYWDHHLNLLDEKKLDTSLSISPHLVCPDNEVHKAWILDIADYSLKKVNLLTGQIELEAPLPKGWSGEAADFVFLREYQNRVFLLDKHRGILMLNMLGKLITSIDVKGLTFFNFLGQELCYRDKNKIQLLDLHTGETRTIAELPDHDSILFTIITDERLVVGRAGKVIIYALQQQ